MELRHAVFTLACSLLAAFCGSSSPTGPSEQNLRLTGRISRSVIPPDGSATITFVLENLGADAVTLTFPDSCQISPYISSSSGSIVYPAGGAWGCATVITELSLPPHGSKSVDVQVRAAATAPHPYVALDPGQYSAYATVRSYSLALKSDPVAFTVE